MMSLQYYLLACLLFCAGAQSSREEGSQDGAEQPEDAHSRSVRSVSLGLLALVVYLLSALFLIRALFIGSKVNVCDRMSLLKYKAGTIRYADAWYAILFATIWMAIPSRPPIKEVIAKATILMVEAATINMWGSLYRLNGLFQYLENEYHPRIHRLLGEGIGLSHHRTEYLITIFQSETMTIFEEFGKNLMKNPAQKQTYCEKFLEAYANKLIDTLEHHLWDGVLDMCAAYVKRRHGNIALRLPERMFEDGRLQQGRESPVRLLVMAYLLGDVRMDWQEASYHGTGIVFSLAGQSGIFTPHTGGKIHQMRGGITIDFLPVGEHKPALGSVAPMLDRVAKGLFRCGLLRRRDRPIQVSIKDGRLSFYPNDWDRTQCGCHEVFASVTSAAWVAGRPCLSLESVTDEGKNFLDISRDREIAIEMTVKDEGQGSMEETDLLEEINPGLNWRDKIGRYWIEPDSSRPSMLFYRLAMGIADYWVNSLKSISGEEED